MVMMTSQPTLNGHFIPVAWLKIPPQLMKNLVPDPLLYEVVPEVSESLGRDTAGLVIHHLRHKYVAHELLLLGLSKTQQEQ